jgi:DNA adenine methylase
MKPLVKWSGGKGEELSKIKEYIPDSFDTYLEPFFGGGALFFEQKPNKAVISDVHVELMNFYRVISKRKNMSKIYDYMERKPNDEETYYRIREFCPKTNLGEAKKFYYLRKTCFRGMLRYNRQGKFNIPFGRYKTLNYEQLKEKKYSSLLRKTTIKTCSFETIFEDYNSSDNFMFLDPPYDSTFTDYGYCQFGEKEHRKLAELFKSTKIQCLMVIGDTPLIQTLYKKYIIGKYRKNYRFKIHSGRVGKEIDNFHLVISNFSAFNTLKKIATSLLSTEEDCKKIH